MDIKIYQGPESPADLQWSQGAKNPRKETQTTNYNIDHGTSLGDTNDSNKCGAETCDTEICTENVNMDGPPMSDTTSSEKPVESSQVVATKGSKIRLPRGKIRKRKVKKHLIKEIHKGITNVNHPLLKGRSDFELSTIIQPKKIWYKKKLRKKRNIFKEIMKNPLLVAILSGSNKNGLLTRKQSDLIIKKLTESIYLIPEENIIPKFENFTFKDGVLFISCFNEESIIWLKQEKILNLWKAGTARALNQYDFLEEYRYHTFLPGSSRPSSLILKLLTIQNPGLYALNNFIVVKRNEKEDKGVVFKFKIKEVSVDRITAVNMRPYCGMKRITFSYYETKKFSKKTQPKSFQKSPALKTHDHPRYNFGTQTIMKSSKSVTEVPNRNLLKLLQDKLPDPQPFDQQTVPHVYTDFNSSEISKNPMHMRLGSPSYPPPKFDRTMTFSEYFESLKGTYCRQSTSNVMRSNSNFSNNIEPWISSNQQHSFDRPGNLDSLKSSIDYKSQESSRYDSDKALHSNIYEQPYSNYPSEYNESHNQQYSESTPFESVLRVESTEYPNSSQNFYNFGSSNYRNSSDLRFESPKMFETPPYLDTLQHQNRTSFHMRSEESGYWYTESRPHSSRYNEIRPHFSEEYDAPKDCESFKYQESLKQNVISGEYYSSQGYDSTRYQDPSIKHNTSVERDSSEYSGFSSRIDTVQSEAETYLSKLRQKDSSKHSASSRDPDSPRHHEMERYFDAFRKEDTLKLSNSTRYSKSFKDILPRERNPKKCSDSSRYPDTTGCTDAEKYLDELRQQNSLKQSNSSRYRESFKKRNIPKETDFDESKYNDLRKRSSSKRSDTVYTEAERYINALREQNSSKHSNSSKRLAQSRYLDLQERGFSKYSDSSFRHSDSSKRNEPVYTEAERYLHALRQDSSKHSGSSSYDVKRIEADRFLQTSKRSNSSREGDTRITEGERFLQSTKKGSNNPRQHSTRSTESDIFLKSSKRNRSSRVYSPY